jgi:two-component system response regulator DegU
VPCGNDKGVLFALIWFRQVFPKHVQQDSRLLRARKHFLKKTRVVLADDSSRILAAIKKLLSSQFDIVECALNGEQAVDAVMCLQPDLVVLDIVMPQLDGIQAARRLKQLGSTAKIIFVTGIEDPDYIKAASNLGSDGFVFKSSMRKDLALAITAALEGGTFYSSKNE